MLLSTDSRGWNILTSFYNYTIQAILVAKERSREEQVLGEHFCGESVTQNISGVMYFIKTDVYDDEVNQLRSTILRQRVERHSTNLSSCVRSTILRQRDTPPTSVVV